MSENVCQMLSQSGTFLWYLLLAKKWHKMKKQLPLIFIWKIFGVSYLELQLLGLSDRLITHLATDPQNKSRLSTDVHTPFKAMTAWWWEAKYSSQGGCFIVLFAASKIACYKTHWTLCSLFAFFRRSKNPFLVSKSRYYKCRSFAKAKWHNTSLEKQGIPVHKSVIIVCQMLSYSVYNPIIWMFFLKNHPISEWSRSDLCIYPVLDRLLERHVGIQ